MAFLRGYLAIFIRYGDHAAAKRNGQLQELIVRKRRARRLAVRGRL